MSVRLEQLLASATPGPWIVQQEDPWIAAHISYDDAALIALAPDMARLLLDMGDALWRGKPAREVDALLARLDALGKDTA